MASRRSGVAPPNPSAVSASPSSWKAPVEIVMVATESGGEPGAEIESQRQHHGQGRRNADDRAGEGEDPREAPEIGEAVRLGLEGKGRNG